MPVIVIVDDDPLNASHIMLLAVKPSALDFICRPSLPDVVATSMSITDKSPPHKQFTLVAMVESKAALIGASAANEPGAYRSLRFTVKNVVNHLPTAR